MNMSRLMPRSQGRPLLLWVIVAILIRVATPASAERPNILMIAVDDLRPELACYGAEYIHSPHIDALAKTGVRFDRAYCSVAVCGASRHSLLSGCRPETTQNWDHQTRLRSTMPNVLTLPGHFAASGYHTAFLGKIYHHADDDAESWTVDVDAWAPPNESPGVRFVKLSEYADLVAASDNPKVKKGPSTENGGDVPDNAYQDGEYADRAIALLERFKNEDQPFFLAVGFHKPHLPFTAPGKYWDLYDRNTIPIPSREKMKDSLPWARSGWGELKNYPDIGKGVGPYLDDDTTRRLIHGYRACVSYTDAQVGRLTAALRELNLDQNTIVLLWGDHGWYVGDYGEWCKHTNYEIATRVPLMMSVPESVLPGGQRGVSTQLAELLDIYPTLCELTGTSTPDHLHGHSLVPLLKDLARPWREAAISQYIKKERVVTVSEDGQRKVAPVANLGTSVRTDRFRFTRWERFQTGEFVAEELVDLDRDPHSTRNVIADPEYADRLPHLRTLATQSATGIAP